MTDKRRSIDKRRLIEDADAFLVAEALGIEMRRKGNKISILCPSHDDRHFGNCVLDERGYKCFACGDRGDVIDLVMKTLNAGFVDACEVVAETCGGAEHYMSGKTPSKRDGAITKKEAALIGLDPGPVRVARYVTDDPDEAEAFAEQGSAYREDDGIYVVYAADRGNPFTELFEEDEDLYRSVIADKCVYEAELCVRIMNALAEHGLAEKDTIRTATERRLSEIADVAAAHADTETVKTLSEAKRKIARDSLADAINRELDASLPF
jgi:hypothetical protein